MCATSCRDATPLRPIGRTLDRLTRPFGLKTVLVSASGSRAEKGVGGFMLAFGMCFTLYMVIVIYGSQVMQGVLEEKSSRVIEVIASAIRPAELMTGKLVGICLVALTQLAIWVAAALVLTAPGIVGALLATTPGRNEASGRGEVYSYVVGYEPFLPAFRDLRDEIERTVRKAV